MSLSERIGNTLSNGVLENLAERVFALLPKNLTIAEREEIELEIAEATCTYYGKLLTLSAKQDAEYNRRLKGMEGTAKDLLQFGLLGRIVWALRNLQRFSWVVFLFFLNMMIFSGGWQIPETEAASAYLNLTSAFWMINVLILGFLFGEFGMNQFLAWFFRRN